MARPNPLPAAVFAILVSALIGCQVARTAFVPEVLRLNDRALATIDPDVSARLPIEPVGPLVGVRGSVNGEPGFRFVLDTGAGVTALVDGPRMRALGLKPEGTVEVAGVGEGPRLVADYARGVAIAIGPLTLNGMAPVLLPPDALAFVADEDGVLFDGIIGYDLLRRVTLDVDLPNGVVRIHPPGRAPEPAGRTTLALSVRHRQAFVEVPMYLPGAARPRLARLHLDTGLRGTLLMEQGFSPALQPTADGAIRVGLGLQGRRTQVEGPELALEFGPYRLTDIPMYLLAGPTLGASDGVLGAKVMNRFRYLVDYAEGQLLLAPTPDWARPFAEGWFGLVAFPDGPGYRIATVEANSPAGKAGLAAGQLIRRVDGEPTASMSVHTFTALFSGPEGLRREVCVATSEPGEPGEPGERCVAVIAR